LTLTTNGSSETWKGNDVEEPTGRTRENRTGKKGLPALKRIPKEGERKSSPTLDSQDGGKEKIPAKEGVML